jgi:nondiscriminating aspartyl-tRNA synthetase
MCAEIRSHAGEEVTVKGWTHRVRSLGRVRFILVRDRTGLAQVVASGSLARDPAIDAEAVVEVTGLATEAPQTAPGIEVQASSIRVLSAPVAPLPFEVNLPEVEAGLETVLNHRVIALRNPKARAVFTVQSAIAGAFRDFLSREGFAEVHTPKIVATGTEGGADLFAVEYFGKKAYLAQSPQFYKQMLVGAGFERVFEVGPVFRAERHNTSRHLNEFTSLDLEMAFIDGLDDLLRLEERLLDHIVSCLRERCSEELALFSQAGIPSIVHVPCLTMTEIAGILRRKCGKELTDASLDAEGERLICEHVRRETGSPFVFATHFPVSARPMYALPDPSDPSVTQSFDLLFRGMEMNSGGMRINDYGQLVASMSRFGLDPRDFESYLEVFRHGMPPHGGFAIGLERLTAKILGLENIREATLFPRDRDRLTP